MSQSPPQPPVRFWSRLRTRIAASYVAVTLLIVLLLESLVVGVVLYIFTASPVTGYWALMGAGNAAQVYALQAALHAGEAGLDPDTTFAPGRPASLELERNVSTPSQSWFGWMIPYVERGSGAPSYPAFALLISPDERIVASSYPDRFPAEMPAPEAVNLPRPTPDPFTPGLPAPAVLPEDVQLIRDALAGKSHGMVRETATGTYASAVRTVWSRDQQVIGAIYVQMPAGGPPDTNLLPELAAIVIPSGLAWLCLMLPLGLVFGFLSTRLLIRRIERLAQATARFKEGDADIRVPVGRMDEIGQLEGQFNLMAEQLVESFAQRQALAEQSARREERARIEQEMSSAHYIQKSLLPDQAPAIPGWQVESFYLPAREVGGDLYDFLALPDGQIGFVIGDATGKGVPSALIMATTVAMLRAAAPGAVSPGQVLALVNNLLQDHIPAGTFATCFYAMLDPAGGRLRYANAGHNLPYLRRDGQVRELRATGLPLGLMPDHEYVEGEIDLTPQDCVLFYTDGLVEAHNDQREMYGLPRLKQRLQEHAPDGRGDGLIEFLNRDLQSFTGADWEQEDDVTLVILRRMP